MSNSKITRRKDINNFFFDIRDIRVWDFWNTWETNFDLFVLLFPWYIEAKILNIHAIKFILLLI